MSPERRFHRRSDFFHDVFLSFADPIFWPLVSGRPLRLLAENHFALPHELVVEPQAVFVAGGFAPGTRRAAQQAHARGRLKNIGGKRTAVDVKLDAQISRVGNPGNLITGIKDHRLRNQSNEYQPFCFFVRSQLRLVASPGSHAVATIAHSAGAFPLRLVTVTLRSLPRQLHFSIIELYSRAPRLA